MAVCLGGETLSLSAGSHLSVEMSSRDGNLVCIRDSRHTWEYTARHKPFHISIAYGNSWSCHVLPNEFKTNIKQRLILLAPEVTYVFTIEIKVVSCLSQCQILSS